MTSELLKTAKQHFYNKEYNKALEIFIKENRNYETGLCYLLLREEKAAYKYWNKDKNNCLGCAWGLCVLKLINLDVTKLPTFFQTRAFLEVYLNLFLKNNLIDWAENLISCCDNLFYSNPEAYKFIARALFANGYFELSIKFCKKSLSVFYSDPETFLILSQCQYLLGDLGGALDSVNRVMDMLDTYYPAKLFQKILKDEIAKKYKTNP